jgi:redox-sensing transcriptional repressor
MMRVEGAREPIKAIPEPTLRRLPIYYQYLKKVQAEKRLEFISCTQIGNDLNVQSIQVRKDLQIADAVGKPKTGYSIAELLYRGFLRVEQYYRCIPGWSREPWFSPP